MFFSIEARPVLVPLSVQGNYALLPLWDRKDGAMKWAKIDLDDYERCKHYSWYLHPLGYAIANTANRSCMLSKFIYFGVLYLVEYPFRAAELTFANGDRLDCRRENLVP